MPWPFDEKDLFNELIKDFENLHHSRPDNFRQEFVDKKPQIQINPRAYYMHDPRHVNERKASTGSSMKTPNLMSDTEMNLDGNFKSLLGFDANTYNQRPSENVNSHESVSSSWIIKNGKMCKQERREKVVGRTRTVSVTSTDENGNETMHEYSENI